MRISDMRRGLYGLLALVWAAFAAPDRVMSATASGWAPVKDDFALAERALRDGQVESGVATLKAAAQRGSIRAGMRLAKIHAEGKLVPRDEAKACELYGAVADRHAQIDRADPAAKLIAEAFRMWAFCYMKGVAAPGWEQNLSKAAVLFYQAGVMLDDVDSIYELARMYLKGEGVAPNPRLAVHYLFSASRKRFPPAQAILGSLMWEGRVLKQQRVTGLAMIKFALDISSAEDRGWIDREYEEAKLTAKNEEETEALRLVAEWKRAYSTDSTGTTSPLIVPTPPVTTSAPPEPAVAATPPMPSSPRAAGAQTLPAPRQQVATPAIGGNGVKPIEQQDSYNTQPTGQKIPAADAPEGQ
jgi:uncharacterized protein